MRAGVKDGARRSDDLDRIQSGRSNDTCSYRLFVHCGFRGSVVWDLCGVGAFIKRSILSSKCGFAGPFVVIFVLGGCVKW